MSVSAVILAAGLGERMGGEANKVLLTLCGDPLLLRAVRPFALHPRISEIVVVVRDGEAEFITEALASLDRPIHLVDGGAARRDSALHGVRAASGTHVLIHDGARPLVGIDVIERVIDATIQYGAAIPVVPSVDTLHVRDANGAIERTLDRTRIVRAQTPQGFERPLILEALGQASQDVTDDAEAVMTSGHPVQCVAGDARNIKITRPEDLSMAAAIASDQ